MLDVQRRNHMDSGIEQLFDILIALRVLRTGHVRVRKFVNQHDLRFPGENRRDIHFRELDAVMHNHPARNDFKSVKTRFGLSAAVGFDQADDHIDVLDLLQPPGLFQHLHRLADSGAVAEIDFQLAAAGAANQFQKIVGGTFIHGLLPPSA